MTYDNENLLATTEDKTPLPSLPPLVQLRQKEGFDGDTISYLAHDLSDALLTGDNDAHQKLQQQLGVLHALFQITANKVSGTLVRNNNNVLEPYFNTNYLQWALRLQEHSVNTAKALSQMSYMNHLERYGQQAQLSLPGSCDPHPPIEPEQKEDGA
ncbi:MAG: hypothetical protein R3D88_06165 [Alphaproteobacteria bacterium]